MDQATRIETPPAVRRGRTSWKVAVAAALGWALVASITLGPQVALTLAGLGAIVALVLSLVVAEELDAADRVVVIGDPLDERDDARTEDQAGWSWSRLRPYDRIRLRSWLAGVVAQRSSASLRHVAEEASRHLGRPVTEKDLLVAFAVLFAKAVEEAKRSKPAAAKAGAVA